MRPCVPFAWAGGSRRKNRLGRPGPLTCAAVVAVAWLLPFEAPGQHFYAGVGYGLERAPTAEPAGEPCSDARRASRDGCETGEDYAPFRLFEELTVALGGEPVPEPAGASIVTIEGLAGERPEFALEDRADSSGPGNRRSLSRFIAPSFNISAIGNGGENVLSPFLGGGLGAVRTGSGETGTSFAEPGSMDPGATKIGSAWMVTAGVAATLDGRTTVELAWRYNHLGDAKTGRGSGRVEWRDRGRPIPTNLALTSAEAQSHGIRLSLRYGF